MKLLLKMVLAGLVMASSPSSGAIYCSSASANPFVDAAGNVIFYNTSRAGYTQVCNLNSSWKGTATSTCFAWFSTLNSAATFGKTVMVNYPGDEYTCSTLPTYASSPAPGYIMIMTF